MEWCHDHHTYIAADIDSDLPTLVLDYKVEADSVQAVGTIPFAD